MSTPITPSPDATSGPVPEPAPAGSPTSSEINALAAQIGKLAADPTASTVLSQGVITAVALTATPPTCSLTLSGGTTVVDGVQFVQTYTPVVNDIVLVGKQGNGLIVIGTVATGSSTSGMWVAPTLSSGFTTNGNSNGALMYRYVLDNGDMKIQWKGSVAHTGSNTAIISAANGPANHPSAKVSRVTARDVGSGTHAVGLDFNTDGSVSVVAPTVQSAHLHALGTSDVQLSGYLSLAGSDLGHAHGLGNSIGTTSSVADPTWISFHGIEYFL